MCKIFYSDLQILDHKQGEWELPTRPKTLESYIMYLITQSIFSLSLLVSNFQRLNVKDLL